VSVFLNPKQREAVRALDAEGWRLCLLSLFVDGSAYLSGHHFETFEQRHLTLADDGSIEWQETA